MELTTNYGWSMPEPTDPVNSSAEYAENMELIDGVVKDIADEVTAVDQGLTALATTVAGKLNKSGGTMSGDLDMSNNKIKNIPTPTTLYEPTNKLYVDSALTGKLSIAGGTMLGDINMNNNHISSVATPTFNYDVATKKYVDDTVANIDEFLPISGGIMDGAINMGGNAIHQLQVTPVYNTDATSKKYVDDNDADKVSKSATTKQTVQSSLYFGEGGGIGWKGTVDGVDIIASDGTSVGELSCGDLYANTIEAMGIENHNARITGVGTPINNTDAATKGYVDASHPLIITATKVNNNWTFDKTPREVVDAGVNSVIHLYDGGYLYVLTLRGCKADGGLVESDSVWKTDIQDIAESTAYGYYVNLYNGEWTVSVVD